MTIDIDKIERLAQAGVSHLSDVLALIAEVRRLRAELNDFTSAAGDLNAEVTALAPDADRYRWLGKQVAFGEWCVGFEVSRDRYGATTEDRWMDDKADMDAQIDEARAKEKA